MELKNKIVRMSTKYTETTSRIGNMPRSHHEFESGKAGAEAAQLE